MHSIINDLRYSLFPDNSKYLTWKEGDTNIVLSAPHGGGMKPINIPNRKYGNRSGDTYTRRLIQAIIERIDKSPFHIYADIHRCKVDLNRDIVEGAQGNKIAEAVWNDWNSVLNYFTWGKTWEYKKILYIDIHSHNNSDQFQIGYGLSVEDYLAVKQGRRITKKSTMYALKNKTDTSEYNVLFGNGSFPHQLTSHGYKVLVPTSEKSYLNGGRNIKENHSNNIGAIQIESPISVLRDDLDNVADTLTVAIETFQKRFM